MMIKNLLLISSVTCSIMRIKPTCVEYDVESTILDRKFVMLEREKLSVIKSKNPEKFIIGDVKVGNLTEMGSCNYKSRHVVVDTSKKQKLVKIVTDYNNKKTLVAQYIETKPGEYKNLVKTGIELNLNEQKLPDEVESFYDDHHELTRIQVKDSFREIKIGKVRINEHIIEDLPNSTERIIYKWDSKSGRRNIKIDTHLNDNKIISDKFVEESPGSKKYVKEKDCVDEQYPFGCWDLPQDI